MFGKRCVYNRQETAPSSTVAGEWGVARSGQIIERRTYDGTEWGGHLHENQTDGVIELVQMRVASERTINDGVSINDCFKSSQMSDILDDSEKVVAGRECIAG
ncbi:hypothetical protein CHS0354_030897, partial [Potamilus streckersoni]